MLGIVAASFSAESPPGCNVSVTAWKWQHQLDFPAQRFYVHSLLQASSLFLAPLFIIILDNFLTLLSH